MDNKKARESKAAMDSKIVMNTETIYGTGTEQRINRQLATMDYLLKATNRGAENGTELGSMEMDSPVTKDH
jgi:hypothetical protein